MEPIDIIIRYKRFLKRVNYSKKTIRNYLYTSKKFITWLDVPVEKVKSEIIFASIWVFSIINGSNLKRSIIT